MSYYEKKVNKVLHELSHSQFTEVEWNGSLVNLKIVADGNQIFISTPVYFGDNYIPKSVRKCLTQQILFAHVEIKTFLTVNETLFKITLNYIGNISEINQEEIKELLESFTWIAEKWRAILEENDKHDLIYIHAK